MAAFSWRTIAMSTAMTTEPGGPGTELTALGSPVLVHQGPHRQPLRRVFKGVVPQPNGRWGAQIYEGYERVWLGTFPDQGAAARAYDVAALRYRGREAPTNFHKAGQQQLAFLAAHSKSEVVGMLRNQTYADELLRHGVLRRGVPAPPAWARVPLFEKAVTQSDVGKLSRLVLPRKHAERHLPPVQKGGVLLGFVDGEGKVWRFRYSYWESSRSYVLTKGWSRFVQEKGLRVGDTVAFSRWAFGPDEQLLIDYRKKKQPKEKEKDDGPAEAIAVPDPVVKLFGVDIAV